jgi:Spy/CpxP family protein refolding chaperone
MIVGKGVRSMKTVFALVAVVAFLTFPILAMAQGWGMQQGMGYVPSWMGSWASRLNLSHEQVQKLEALHERFLKETISMRNDLDLKQIELRTLWLQTNPEEEKILAKEKEINGLWAQIQEKATKYLLEGRKVLTPGQQAEATAFFMRGGFWVRSRNGMDG